MRVGGSRRGQLCDVASRVLPLPRAPNLPPGLPPPAATPSATSGWWMRRSRTAAGPAPRPATRRAQRFERWLPLPPRLLSTPPCSPHQPTPAAPCPASAPRSDWSSWAMPCWTRWSHTTSSQHSSARPPGAALLARCLAAASAPAAPAAALTPSLAVPCPHPCPKPCQRRESLADARHAQRGCECVPACLRRGAPRPARARAPPVAPPLLAHHRWVGGPRGLASPAAQLQPAHLRSRPRRCTCCCADTVDAADALLPLPPPLPRPQTLWGSGATACKTRWRRRLATTAPPTVPRRQRRRRAPPARRRRVRRRPRCCASLPLASAPFRHPRREGRGRRCRRAGRCAGCRAAARQTLAAVDAGLPQR